MAMSINKLTFTDSTVEAEATTLYNWLNNNTKNFLFDDIVMEDGWITCYTGEYQVVKFGVASGNQRCQVFNKAENTVVRFRTYSAYSNKPFKYAVKTSTGIVIAWANYSSNAVYDSIWISKTDLGTIGIVMIAQNSSSQISYLGVIDFEHSSASSRLYGGDKSPTSKDWNDWFCISGYSFTSLSPISVTQDAFATPSYLPNVYFLKFSQFTTLGGTNSYKVTLNGEEYFSNGWLAIRG
jgi:hypothetical protein